uniref:Putative ovule protein n=1 Tax=Solanum chacoense TaxID=4108 RepID=A0A0V0GYU5_SOLCH
MGINMSISCDPFLSFYFLLLFLNRLRQTICAPLSCSLDLRLLNYLIFVHLHYLERELKHL